MVNFTTQVLSIHSVIVVPCVLCASCVAAKLQEGPAHQETQLLTLSSTPNWEGQHQGEIDPKGKLRDFPGDLTQEVKETQLFA